ncbi:MAG: hypothetical protein KF777_00680 [Planctomycetaceae bacterium]|nr:hypothetical protein [Planctomycetaceae bacterium]
MTIQDVDFSGWQFFSHPVVHKPRIRFTGCSPNFHDKRSKLFRGGAVLAIMVSGLSASAVDARPDLPEYFRGNLQKTGLQLVHPNDRRRPAAKARRLPTANRTLPHVNLSGNRPTLSVRIAFGDIPSRQKVPSERDGSLAIPVEPESTGASEIPDATAPSTMPPCTQSADMATCPSLAATEQLPASPPVQPPQPIFTLRRIILLGVLAAGFGLLALVRR